MQVTTDEILEIIDREDELFQRELEKKVIDSILEIRVNKKIINQIARKQIVDLVREMIKDEMYLLNGYGALNNYESFYKASLYIEDKEDLIKKFKILINIAIANNMVLKLIHVKPILKSYKKRDNVIVLKKAI